MSALAVLVPFAKTKGTRACAKAVALAFAVVPAFAIALAVTPNKKPPPAIPTTGQMAMMGIAALDPSYGSFFARLKSDLRMRDLQQPNGRSTLFNSEIRDRVT